LQSLEKTLAKILPTLQASAACRGPQGDGGKHHCSKNVAVAVCSPQTSHPQERTAGAAEPDVAKAREELRRVLEFYTDALKSLRARFVHHTVNKVIRFC
jgi:hypothetical protein